MNIKQNANRAASLVRQLLAFSRKQTLRPEVLNLTDVLADLRMLLARLVGNCVKLKVDHGRDLWPVKVDIGQFEQVVVNLAVNARDAMPDGGDLTVRTKNVTAERMQGFRLPRACRRPTTCWSRSRTPAAASRPTCWRRSSSRSSPPRKSARAPASACPWSTASSSRPAASSSAIPSVGKGTVFRIFLPRHVPERRSRDARAGSASLAAEPDAAATKAADAARDLSGSATVLLVEDEDAVRMGGMRALTSRGYTVHEASSGVEALEVYHALDGKIDIVVSDVVMPEMDGPTLLGELRKMRPDIKFIFVSGYAEDAFAKNLPADAKFGFLPKPFSLKQLATVVKEVLEAE